jgi:hypothetical protein
LWRSTTVAFTGTIVFTGLDPVIQATSGCRRTCVPSGNLAECGAPAWITGSSPRLSGSIFLYKAHGIDSTDVWTLATFPDTKGATPCDIRIACSTNC